MTFRLTALCRQGLFRLGSGFSHRPFSMEKKSSLLNAAAQRLSTKYDDKQTNQVLMYVNEQYKGRDRRLQALQSTMNEVYNFRVKSGPIMSIDDLVEVVGLPQNIAVILCNEIIKFSMKKRNNIQYTNPTFSAKGSESIDSVLAIHTSLLCVTWAHLERSGRLKSWHKIAFPPGEKRENAIDNIRTVMTFCNDIPHADLYILETPDRRRSVNANQLVDGFLLASIDCSILAAISLLHPHKGTNARMHYMNRTLAPLLFDLCVGVEIVSRYKAVEALIDSTNPNRQEYRDVIMDEWLLGNFKGSNEVTKEELSIPLLSAIAAMELLVLQNPYAIKKVQMS